MIKKVYESLVDEKSRKMYINRLLNYLTGDLKYIIEMINLNEHDDTEGIKLADFYYDLMKNKTEMVIWGAGSSGSIRYRFFNKQIDERYGYDGVKYFVDSNPEIQNSGCEGKKVISPEEFSKIYNGEPILIESFYYEDEILSIIKKMFDNYTIIKHPIRKIQYFDEMMKFSDDEVFLDCGCFNCITIMDFLKAVNGKYKKIIAFEPDNSNYNFCVNTIRENGWNNIELINKGIWDKETCLGFIEAADCSRVVEQENYGNTLETKVEVVDIDSVVGDEKVTFIKMDIEGSELKALKGAERTIIKNKPKLAICIYHKPEDIITIPEYLKTIVPEYKFGIRHYGDYWFETVLYAFVD